MPDSDGRKRAALGRLVTLAVLVAAGVALSLIAWNVRTSFKGALYRAYPEANQQRQHGGEADEKTAWVDEWQSWYADAALDIGVFQLILGIVGVVGVGYTVYYARHAWKEAERSADAAQKAIDNAAKDAAEQAKRFGQQLAAARKSAAAAAKAADAAMIQAQSIVAGQRAYLALANRLTKEGKATRLHVMNTGLTQAVIHHYVFEPYAELPPLAEWMGWDGPVRYIARNVPREKEDRLPDTELPDDARFLLGCLVYADVFRKLHKMWFRYDLDGDIWFASADPDWNEIREIGEEQ